MEDPSLYQAFQASVRVHAGRIAIRSESGDLTYEALQDASREIGRALLALGIERGDRIAIWGVNSAEWVVAALGIQAVGAVLVPVGTRLRGREAEVILRDSGARIIFSDSGFGSFNYIHALQSIEVPELERIVVIDGAASGREDLLALTDLKAIAAPVTDQQLDIRVAKGSGQDLSDIIFTSGTTGRPKGVPMTCAQSLAACKAQQEDVARFTPDDVFAVTYPFAHNAGYRAGWQISLLYGVRIIPVRIFDPGELLKMIEREGITFLPTAPPVAQGIIDHPDRDSTDLSSLRCISTGGTTIPVKLVEDMRRYMGHGTEIQTGYGLTETAGSVTVTSADDRAEVIATTVGHALKSLDVIIVGPDQKELPRGEVGEIAVRGPQVMKEYYNNSKATEEAFTPEGFLLTGDAGSMDEIGNIRITDRIKEMYLVGGFNCYPAEIEHAMRGMPGVGQVAVIGVDDERLGQVGRAFIVPAEGSVLAEADVIAWCRNEMANYKVPRSVVFLEALPLNAMGKVAKTELRVIA